MNARVFKDVAKLEADLWAAADNLRANSKLAPSDYFLSVLDIIVLDHGANRFEVAGRQTAEDQGAGRIPESLNASVRMLIGGGSEHRATKRPDIWHVGRQQAA